MANRAIFREAHSHMFRIRRLLIVGEVARAAIARCSCILPAHVALRAGKAHVCSGERKTRIPVVIESDRGPVGCVMADRAILREPCLRVIRIRGARKILQMAAHAGRAQHLKIAGAVAGRTVQRGMHSGQRKSGEFEVIERRPIPAIHVVARLAGGGESRRLVVGEARLLELLGVARDAIGGKSLELTHRHALVAIVAGEGGVRPHKRKTVFVTSNVLEKDLPAAHRVAPSAVRSELSLVNIGVTVGALRSDICENQTHMTPRTGDLRVQAAQGKMRFVVIELHHVSKGLPSCKRVAVLAWDVQSPMRTAGRGRLTLCLNGWRGEHKKETKQPDIAQSELHVCP